MENRPIFIPEKRLHTSVVELTTSSQDLYTADETFIPELSSVWLTNKTASPVTVRISYYNGSTDFYLAYDKSVPANDSITLEAATDTLVHLKDGYKIKGLAGSNSAIDCFVSMMITEGRKIT